MLLPEHYRAIRAEIKQRIKADGELGVSLIAEELRRELGFSLPTTLKFLTALFQELPINSENRLMFSVKILVDFCKKG